MERAPVWLAAIVHGAVFGAGVFLLWAYIGHTVELSMCVGGSSAVLGAVGYWQGATR